MPDVTSKVITILMAYARDPAAPIGPLTTLRELDIDRMDLPMISLDIEDAFGVQIQYDDVIEDRSTVMVLVASVEVLLDAKAKQPAPRPRAKSNWMSTSCERRR